MSELAETRSSLYCQYALIAGQHLLTLITRIALPYFVAFISVEAGLIAIFAQSAAPLYI